MATEYHAIWEEGGDNSLDDRKVGQLLRRCDLPSAFAFLRLIAGRTKVAPLCLILDDGKTALIKVIPEADYKNGMKFNTI